MRKFKKLEAFKENDNLFDSAKIMGKGTCRPLNLFNYCERIIATFDFILEQCYPDKAASLDSILV